MLSAMFDLTGMVEDLLLMSGKPRKTFLDDAQGELIPATTLAGGTAGGTVGATAEGRLRIHGVGAPGRADLSRPDTTARIAPARSWRRC